MAIIGYARVSSTGQSLEVQLDRLARCDKVFREKTSGSTAARPEFKACIEYVREGDRLARSTLHLCQIAEQLQRKRVAEGALAGTALLGDDSDRDGHAGKNPLRQGKPGGLVAG